MANDYNRPNEFDRPNEIEQSSDRNLEPTPNKDKKHAKKAGDGTMGFMLWSIAGTVLAACSSPIFSDVADLTGGGGSSGDTQGGSPGFVTNGRWANTNIYVVDESGIRDPNADAVGITDGAGNIIFNDEYINLDTLGNGERYMADLEGATEISTGRRGMSGEELLSLPYHGGVLIISPLTDLLANAYIETAPQDMTREEFYQVTLDQILGQRPQFDATTGDAITGTESSVVTVEDVLNADNYNPFADNNIAAELVSLASTTLGLIEEEASDTSATERVEALTNSLDDTRGQLMTEADEDVLSFTLDSDSSIRGIDDLDGDVNARVAVAVARGGLPVVGTPNGGEAIPMTEGENFVLSRANSNPVLLFGFEDPFDNDVDGQPGGEREPGQLVGIYIEAASADGDIAVMFGDATNNVALAGADRVAASDAAIPAMTTVGGVTFYFVSEANLDRLVLRPTDGDFNTADESVNNPQIRFYVHDGEHATLADGATTLDGVGMLEIEVANVNDAPVVTDPGTALITSTSDSDLSGTFTASDIDGDTDFRWSATPTSTPYGEFSFPDPANPGAWTFTLNEAAFDALPAGMDVPLTFDITANDGNGGVSDAATLTIMLQGQNDAPTDITTSVAALVAGYDHAGIPSNGIFIATLSTVDADTGDTHTYTRGGVDGQYFSIRDGSGTESTDGTHLWLDSDAPGRVVGGTWEVVVTSTDSANAATSKTFSITRADASTNLAPTDITTTATGTSAALTATYDGNNVPDGGNGGHVVATLGTTDPNTGDTHTYSIVPVTGEASESFDINGNELILRVSASPAPGDMLEVTVRSTDAGGLMVDKTFTITRAGNADTATDTLAIASEGARAFLVINGVEFRAADDGVLLVSGNSNPPSVFFKDTIPESAIPVDRVDGVVSDSGPNSFTIQIADSGAGMRYSQARIAGIWNTQNALSNSHLTRDLGDVTATIVDVLDGTTTPTAPTQLSHWYLDRDPNGGGFSQGIVGGTDEADLVVTKDTDDLTASGWLQVTGGTGDITFGNGGTGGFTASGQLGSAAHTDTRKYTFVGDYGDLVIDGDGDWVYTLGGTTAQDNAVTGLTSTIMETFRVSVIEDGSTRATQPITIIVNEAPAPLAVSSEGVRQHLLIYGVEFRALEDGVGNPAGIFFNNAGAETVTVTGGSTFLTYGIRASSFSQADIARIWNTDTTSSTNEGNSGGAFVATIIEEMSGINTLAQWRIMETGGADVTTSNGFRRFTAGTDEADRVVTEVSDLMASGWLQVTGGAGDITFGDGGTRSATASGQLGSAAHTDTRTYTFVGDYGDLVIDGDGDWVYTLGGVANSANAATYQTNIDGLNSAGTETFEVEITRGGVTVDQDIMITVNIAADGANEAPTLSAPIPADNGVTEDDTGDATVTGGTLTFDDPDAGQDKSNLRVYVAAGATATDASTEVAPGATGADTEVPVVGTYGTFTLTRTMAGDVTWTYTLDHTDADTQALGHGQSVTDQLAVIVYDAAGVDSGGEVITIDVTGVNDAPVVDSLLDAAITITDSGVPGADSRVTTGSLTGTFTVTDDMGDTHTFTTRGHGGAVGVENGERSDDGFTHSVNGRYGMLFYDDQSGAYEYVPDETEIDALNDGDQPGDPFAIFATDNSGQANNMSTATPLLNVTIIGANEDAAPVADLVVTSQSTDTTVTEDDAADTTATGTLVVTDPPLGATYTYAGTFTGIYGALTVDTTGRWTYTIDNAAAQVLNAGATQDTITVTITEVIGGENGRTDDETITITVNGVNDDVAPDSLTVESEGARQHLLIYGVEFRALEDGVGDPGGIYFNNNTGVETVTVTGVTGSFSYGIRASSFSQADIARIWNTDTTSSTNEGNSGGAFVATIIEEMSINMLAEWRAMEDGGAEVTTDNGFRRFISGTDDADLMVTEDNDLTASGWLQVTGGTGDITFGKDATSGVTVTGQLGGASGATAHTDTREYTYAGRYGNLVIDGDGDWVYTLGGTDAQNNALAALASTDTEMDPFTVEVSRGDEMEELEIEITVNGADNLTVTNEAVRAFVIVNGVEFRVNTDGDERTAYEIDFRSTSDAGRVNINNDDLIELRATSTANQFASPSDPHFSQANIARLFNAANLANLEVAAIILEGNTTNALANWDSSEDDTTYDFITASTALDLAVTEDDEADSTAHGFLEVTGGTGSYTYSGDFEGIYGDLIVDGDGNWTYVLDNTDDDTQGLRDQQAETDSFTVIVSDSSSPAIMGRQQIEITVNGADEVSPLTVESEGMRTHLLIYGVEFRQLVDGDDVVGGNNGVIFFPNDGNENIARTTDGFGINTLTYSQANIANLWNTYTDNGNIVTQGLVATIIEENDINTLAEWRAMEDDGAGVRGTFATRDFTLGTDEADTDVTEGTDLTASGWLHVTDTTTGDITFGEDETNGVTVTGQLGGASGSAANTDTRKYTYAGIYGNLVIDGDGDWVYTLGGSEVQNNALAALTPMNGGTDPFEVAVRETGGAMRRKTEMIEIAVTGADVPAFATSRSGTMVTITDTDRAADNVPAPVTGTISLTAETDDTDLTWTIAEPTVTGTNEDAGHFGGFSLTSRPHGFSSGSILENIGRELEWTFTPRNINDLDAGQSVVITRSITIMNGDGMANQDLVITVNGFTPLFEDDGLTPITGAAGNEDLEGMDSGSANELIQGGDGNDIIETLGGNDVVIGGSGVDDITLGDPSVPAQAGAETVVYRFESDGAAADGGWTATDNYDVIRNFERGTDKLVLVDVHNQDGMGTGTPIASLDDLIADTNDRPVVNVTVDADSGKITHISIVFELSAVGGDIFSRTIEVSLASDTQPDLTDFSINQSDNNRLTDYDQLAELFGGEEFLLVGDASQLPDGLEIL